MPHALTFTAMTPAFAATLVPAIASVDPWARLGITPAAITKLLETDEPGVVCRAITAGAEPVGAIVVHVNWLLGPYLRHLSIREGYRGRGAGAEALDWLAAFARARNARNIWLCVSEFNDGARRFYTRHGFETAALIDDLVLAGENEILMRRRLGPAETAGAPTA